MKPYERFLKAVRCGTPDRVPVFDHLYSLKFMKDILGYTTELYEGAPQIELATKIGMDSTVIPHNGFCGFEDEPHKDGETYVDEWGVTYVHNGWPVMAQTGVALSGRSDWEKYKLPDPGSPHRLQRIMDAIKANTGEIALIVNILGPFTMAYWYFFDLATLSLLIFDDPDLIHEVNDAYVDWVLRMAELIADLDGVHVFMLSDDWGGTSSLLMSPEHLRSFFIPPFRKIVQGLKGLGRPVIMHNDGNIWKVLDDLVNTGINGYHPVERAASMDLEKVTTQYKGRLCPVGNINNKTTMVTGTPEEVEREALQCIRTAAPGGGYVLATDHSIHDDIPAENVMAFIEAARKHGVYPIKT